MLYPLFFYPIYKSAIWGGNKIKYKFNRITSIINLGESWEISCHNNDISIVANGELKGKKLSELFSEHRNDIFGAKSINLTHFPILIKFIDASTALSVQVHPGDEYAAVNDNDSGKTELWYIVEAEESAKIVYGLKPDVRKCSLINSISNEHIEDCLNYISVKKGDFVYIPSGTVHCLLGGALVAEIQQNSDTTYRLYDWNRVDSNGNRRDLHMEKALDVINFNDVLPYNTPKTTNFIDYSISELASCPYFNVEKLKIQEFYKNCSNPDSFMVFTCVDGSGKIYSDKYSYEILQGSTFLIPANLGKFIIKGNLTLLKTFI